MPRQTSEHDIEYWTKWQAEYRKDVYLHGRRRINKAGTIRRLEALMVNGWSIPEIARQAMMSKDTLHSLWDDRGRPERLTTKRVARRVKFAYDRLWDKDAPKSAAGTKAKLFAQRNGFAPALAWDNIDDPGERPKGLTPEQRRARAQRRLAA